METKFEYGDYVKVVRDHDIPQSEPSEWIGKVGTVSRITDDSLVVQFVVQFVDSELPEKWMLDNHAYFVEEELEKLETKPFTYPALATSKRNRSAINKAVRRASHNIILGTQSEFYWSHSPYVTTPEEWLKAAGLSKRYRSFKEYAVEIAPEWRLLATEYYADNSIMNVMISGDLRFTRRLMAKAPSGDICF